MILASASPRRRELLARIISDFNIEPAQIDEAKLFRDFSGETNSSSRILRQPEKMVELLALKKAEAVLSLHPQDLVLGADTIVVKDDRVLSKPRDKREAVAMLQALSGSWHEVYTGVAILTAQESVVFSDVARVKFNELDTYQKNMIQDYVNSGHPLDKAGAYGIQEEGAFLIEKISGDFYTIMGLPLNLTRRYLAQLGII